MPTMIHDAPALDRRYRSYLRLLNADERDARYICELRSEETLNRYLNHSKNTVADQVRWLEDYKTREAAGDEYYFAIVSDDADQGVVRLYDFREVDGKRSFQWGSFIMPAPRIKGLVTYTAVLMYELGFDVLGFEQSHFEARAANATILAFHEREGAHIVGRTEQDVFYRFYPEDYRRFREASAGQIAAHRVKRSGAVAT